MYIILDHSASLTFPTQADLCRDALDQTVVLKDAQACWSLFLQFVSRLAQRLALIPNLGWKENEFDSAAGLRLYVYGFTCRNNQQEPKYIVFGEGIQSQDGLDKAIRKAKDNIPSGGSCPGLAIEQAAFSMQANDLTTRPKAAVLITDGIFYDIPWPKYASSILQNYQTLTFATGIALQATNPGSDFGLTPDEVRKQRTQLMNFVQEDESRLFDLGNEGFKLLPVFEQTIVSRLIQDYFSRGREAFFNRTQNGPSCSWTNQQRCLQAEGDHCKWYLDSTLGDMAKFTACNFKQDCGQLKWYPCQYLDPVCTWNGTYCNTIPEYSNNLNRQARNGNRLRQPAVFGPA